MAHKRKVSPGDYFFLPDGSAIRNKSNFTADLVLIKKEQLDKENIQRPQPSNYRKNENDNETK